MGVPLMACACLMRSSRVFTAACFCCCSACLAALLASKLARKVVRFCSCWSSSSYCSRGLASLALQAGTAPVLWGVHVADAGPDGEQCGPKPQPLVTQCGPA